MLERHYVNLTNGIEHLPKLLELTSNIHFIRLMSTTIERKHWFKMLYDLDHDLLLHLALGYTCYIHDCGTRREKSKTIYYGIPMIEYFLNRYWFGYDPDMLMIRSNNAIAYACDMYYRLFENGTSTISQIENESSKVHANLVGRGALKKKIAYYKRYLNCDRISLIGVGFSTEHDGDYEYYRDILYNCYVKQV